MVLSRIRVQVVLSVLGNSIFKHVMCAFPPFYVRALKTAYCCLSFVTFGAVGKICCTVGGI